MTTCKASEIVITIINGHWLSFKRDILWQSIMNEYHQEVYAWYDLEDNCDDWYMDSCHFWDDNHFHILFDDSNPLSVEKINVTHQELVMITSV
jgi:hypothetical protein